MGGYILVFLPDLCLDLRKSILLLVVADALARIRVGVFALRESRVIEFETPG